MKNFIRQWRDHRGMTLEELAEKSEVSAAQISRIERGDKGWSVDSLEKLAGALNVRPGQLLDEAPEQSREVSLGQRIKTARTDAKLRQKDIAAVCGVSIVAVSNWERGIDLPNVFSISEIARLTGVDLTWLITGAKVQS